MRRTATIADVAARAGVGASTVSRVLNDGQVSGTARARVLAAMNELDYRPLASARSLVGTRTHAQWRRPLRSQALPPLPDRR